MYKRRWCHTVRVVGSALRVAYYDKLVRRPKFREELKRTVSAWGDEEQAHLARLVVGVIGAGSVGSLVAENLARMGIRHIRLIDFDRIEFVNLGCLLHATRRDAIQKIRKVKALAKALKRSATSKPFSVDALELSVVEEGGFREALDCDVLFSCVDRPWARFVLNFIAYAHLIPVIDGGVSARVKRNGSGLLRANWRGHVVGPEHRCLECLGQYDPGLVNVERDGYLDKPSYIQGLSEDHILRRNENAFAFSMAAASVEVQQFLRMVIRSPGLPNVGAEFHDFVSGGTWHAQEKCESNCLFQGFIATGDSSGLTVTGHHPVAHADV